MQLQATSAEEQADNSNLAIKVIIICPGFYVERVKQLFPLNSARGDCLDNIVKLEFARSVQFIVNSWCWDAEQILSLQHMANELAKAGYMETFRVSVSLATRRKVGNHD